MIDYSLDRQSIIDVATPIFKKHRVKKAGIFGFYARNEQTNDSDVDFLIEFEQDYFPTLFDLIRLKQDLEKALKKEVDIITKEGLSYRIQSYVLSDLQEVL